MRQVSRNDGRPGFATIADHAFVLTGEDIESLSKKLSGFLPEIEFRIRCRDGSTRIFHSVAELLDYQNDPAGRIRTLQVFARIPAGAGAYEAKFENSFSQSLYVAVDGLAEAEKKELLSFTTRLFDGIRAGYSALHPLIFAAVAGWATVAIIGALRFGPVNDPRFLPGPSRQVLGDRIGAWSALIVIPGVIAGVLAYRFWERIFPAGMFLIGFEKRRHQRLEALRWSGLGALFVSLLVALVFTSFSLNRLTGLFNHFYSP